MVSLTTPTAPAPSDQSLAARKKDIAHFAAFAGVYLILVTIDAWLAFVAEIGSNCALRCYMATLILMVIAELLFALKVFRYLGSVEEKKKEETTGGSGKRTFAFVGGLLGLELALVILLFFIESPIVGTFNFWSFGLFWLGSGAEVAFAPIAGAVEQFMRRASLQQ